MLSKAATICIKFASTKKGRKILFAVIVFLLSALLIFGIITSAFTAAFLVLLRSDEFHFPLPNSSRAAEPFDPDRIITHTYEETYQKPVLSKRPVLDANGQPKKDSYGNIIYETYTDYVTETRTVTEEIESPHWGVDFKAQPGSYAVAAAGGIIKASYTNEEEGNVVEIEHPETDLVTRYLHLDTVLPLEVGSDIIMGQPIGKIGTSGCCTEYRDPPFEHLHFEILQKGTPVDPMPYLKKWGEYKDIPTALIQEVAGAEWADWMVSDMDSPDDIIWNGENYLWPLPNHHQISSPYGPRELNGEKDFHYGIDIPAPKGTPIYAAAPGIVSTKAHWSYGTCVKISVDERTVNIYGHMSARAEGIVDGAVVQAGDLIGYVGNTGNSSGNHLHFEVRVNGNHTNPMPFFG